MEDVGEGEGEGEGGEEGGEGRMGCGHHGCWIGSGHVDDGGVEEVRVDGGGERGVFVGVERFGC